MAGKILIQYLNYCYPKPKPTKSNFNLLIENTQVQEELGDVGHPYRL